MLEEPAPPLPGEAAEQLDRGSCEFGARGDRPGETLALDLEERERLLKGDADRASRMQQIVPKFMVLAVAMLAVDHLQRRRVHIEEVALWGLEP